MKKTHSKLIFGLSALSLSLSVAAADLKAPFALPSAKVLPKGVRNLSYKNIMAGATEKYNANSNRVGIADPFFQDVTFQKAIDSKKEAWEKAAMEQAMLDLGKSPDDSFATSTGDVKVSAIAHVPVLAWGLTSKVTIGAAVPIVQSSLHVDRGVIQTNPQLHNEMIQTLNDKGVPSKVAEFNGKMSDPIGEKLNEYHYNQLENENKTALGDMKLVGKYNFLQHDEHSVTTNLEVTLPTGKDIDVNEAVDVASGDEQTDLGLGLAYDYSLSDSITLSTALMYTWQMPDTAARRVPEVSYSKVSPDIDGNINRDLGDLFMYQLGSAWNYKGVNFGGGYTYQRKAQDNYEGSQYAAHRYDWLEQDTQQEMHAVQVVAGYDTLYLFKKKVFPAPLKVLFTHTRVVDGRNVVKDPLYALDLNLFF